jgi:hypothetical protein
MVSAATGVISSSVVGRPDVVGRTMKNDIALKPINGSETNHAVKPINNSEVKPITSMLNTNRTTTDSRESTNDDERRRH